MPQMPIQDKKTSEIKSHLDRFRWVYYLIILLIFVIIRVTAWSNVSVLEDHDSAHYLRIIKTFQALDFDKIWNLGPDDTFFYPIFSTFFSIPGWSVEFSARLTSLAFSIGLFFLIILISEKIANIETALISLLLFTFNPFFIPLSIAILTEPSYIATIYLGVYLFLLKYSKPTLSSAIFLGIIFAHGFLNRTEGILFIIFIPVSQLIHFMFFKEKRYTLKTYSKWFILYVLIFSIFAAPQIYRVSYKMHTFALNGRQVWEAFMKVQDGRSYEEKKHGLDYSPKQINLTYLQTHPEAYKKLESEENIKDIISLFMAEVSKLQRYQLSELLSAGVLMFFFLGFFSLLFSQLYFEALFIIFMIVVGLFAPALHDVDLRHISIVAPIMIIVAAMGVVFLSDRVFYILSKFKAARWLKVKLSFVILIFIVGTSFSWLHSTIRIPTTNSEYNPSDYLKPVEILHADLANKSISSPIVVSRKSYFAYMSNISPLEIPYTDYKGLVKYCKLNRITYLFLDFKNIQNYPFLNVFNDQSARNFKLMYSALDSFGFKIELYEFLGDSDHL